MSYNLCFLSTCSPLYSSKLPDFKIRDSIFKLLVRDHGVKIHVPIPCAGDSKWMEKVYNGDTKPLFHTLRTLDIKFYPEIRTDLDFDGAMLEGLAFFQDIEAFGKKYTPQEQEDALYIILDKLVSENKPIVLMDNDFVCTNPFNGDHHVLERVYHRYKHYNKLAVIAPMTEYLEPNVKFKHLPFPLDVDTIREDIIPVENRQYICRYIGNNYGKSNTHIPVFNALSKHGDVLVTGYKWTQEDKAAAPNVVFKSAVSMSHDNIYSSFGNSILGISGYSEYQRDSYKDLYHLRWKEFLIAGIYIVTENCKELIDMMPDGTLVFDQIANMPYDELKDKLDYIKANYIKLVKEQRECCVDWCRSDKLIYDYLEVLEI